MAMTLDGHVAHPDSPWNFGSSEDRRRMDRLRNWADCLIVSRKTLEHDNMDLRVRTKPHGRHPRPVVIVNSDRPFRQGLRSAAPDQVAGEVWISRRQQKFSLADLWPDQQPGWELFPYGTLSDVLDSLSTRGLRKVLLEGGPSLNGLFFELNLVDEFFLTILPIAWGGTTTDRAIISAAPLPMHRFSLRSAEKRGNEMFLRYIRK